MSIALRVVLLVFAFCVFLALIGLVFKLLWVVAFLVAFSICLIGAFYLFKKILLPGKKDVSAKRQGETKLWRPDGLITLFKTKPSATQLIGSGADDDSFSDLIQLPSQTLVTVVEQSDIAIKVKIQSGDKKGTIGWVDKAHISGHEI